MTDDRIAKVRGTELDLLAVQYVTGELSAAQIEAFEHRLADDQEARESVARAVTIGMAAASLPEVQLAPVTAGVAAPRRVRQWLAAAAVLLAVLTTIYLLGGWSDGDQPADPIGQDLIASWVDLHDLPGLAGTEWEIDDEADPLFAVILDSAGQDDPLATGGETPSWMKAVLGK